MSRLFANLIVLLAIVTLPWWFTTILLVLWCIIFDYVEIVFYGLVLDILYAVPGGVIMPHIFFISSVILYLLSVIIRPNLRSV